MYEVVPWPFFHIFATKLWKICHCTIGIYGSPLLRRIFRSFPMVFSVSAYLIPELTLYSEFVVGSFRGGAVAGMLFWKTLGDNNDYWCNGNMSSSPKIFQNNIPASSMTPNPPIPIWRRNTGRRQYKYVNVRSWLNTFAKITAKDSVN